MHIFPAIDLYEGKAVRLLRGDYARMTVYSDDPLAVAETFVQKGARHVHLVDLEGAKSGATPNRSVVAAIARNTGLFTEIGGGIRTMQTVQDYFALGVDRVILGTAAVTDPAFLQAALAAYGPRIAVGVDVKDGLVAIQGWTETTDQTLESFCARMQAMGVQTLICTDIARDGAMQGVNRALYGQLSRQYTVNITASGGVSSLDDVRALRALDLYGAIIGKAYYTGAIDLTQAIEVAV